MATSSPESSSNSPSDRVQSTLEELYIAFKDVHDGHIADYIPQLAKADPNWFGVAVCTTDGHVYEVGDSRKGFTMQSVSKPFVYGLALEDNGRDAVSKRVGVEPSGDVFNSIISLDKHSHRPHNPMVNAGAIASASMIQGANLTERLNRLLEMLGRFAGRPMYADASVFMSERMTGHRNRAIAHLMLNFGMLDGSVEDALDLYFQQCSVIADAKDLAVMAATLANTGLNPVTGVQAIDPGMIRHILTVMFTCGMYDFSGQWAFEVGVPAKSGVAGGLLAVIPGQMGIGIYSPLIDMHGTPVRGLGLCRALAERFRVHMFDAWFGEQRFEDIVETQPRVKTGIWRKIAEEAEHDEVTLADGDARGQAPAVADELELETPQLRNVDPTQHLGSAPGPREEASPSPDSVQHPPEEPPHV